MTEVPVTRSSVIWSLGDKRKCDNENIQVICICGKKKVIDHLSVTFYFGSSAKEYLKRRRSFSVSPAPREMPHLSLQKWRYKLYDT